MEQNIKTQKLIYDGKKEETLTKEYSLQEYLPGISRIIKTALHVKDCRFFTEGSQAFAETELKLDIIYLSDFGGKIKCACFDETVKIPFKDSFSHDGEYTPLASVYVSSLSATPVSSRKVKVRAVLQAKCNVFAYEDVSVYSANEKDEELCVLEKKMVFCESFMPDSGIMSVQSEVALESTSPPAGEIVYSRASVHSPRVEIKDGLLNVDASLSMYALYECGESSQTDDQSSSYAAISSDAPITVQLTDSRLKEGQKCLCCADVYSVLCTSSFDSFGESRIISFDVRYILRITVFEEKELVCALDAFGTRCTCSLEPVRVTCRRTTDVICSKQAVKETVHTDLNGLSDVSACFITICSVSKEMTADRHFAVAKCTLEVIGTNPSGELVCVDAPVTFHIPVSSDCPENAVPDYIISVSSCSCNVKDGYLEAEAEFDICGFCYITEHQNVLKSITPDDNAKICKNKGEITVVYPSDEDTVWSVSKKYSTSPDEIRRLNAIAEDCDKPNGIIIIS